MPSFTLDHYKPAADGVTDDTAVLRRCFHDVECSGGGTVVIPPGDYLVSGEGSIPIPSRTTVFAHGARFHLPEVLGPKARLVLFSGQNVTGFAWHGGCFIGHAFDHRRPSNTWEPNANSRMFVITTSPGGTSDNLLFRDIHSERVAGAVINVEGSLRPDSESEVDTFATNIAIRDCWLAESGKFMWDYGLLWQILVWPEDYTAEDLALARRYFRNDLIRGPVGMADGDDRVWFAGGVSEPTVCFLGGKLPANIVRGRRYPVVDSGPGFIRIADAPGEAPLRFSGTAGKDAHLICNLHHAFYHLFAPIGAGPGKGALDLTGCRGTSVSGNRLSALGDTMHIMRCHNNVFANNQILGSRMGAFFLAEHCKNSSITGNTVDGTNGSRVMSVERSNEDVTIAGNTFRGGGRGSWINQPRQLVMQGNIFINNTTKGEHDPWRGRRSFETGGYEQWAEMYFTRYQPSGTYGPVILSGNLFVTGPESSDAITFADGGHDILLDGNVFEGPTRTVRVARGCMDMNIGRNPGMEIVDERSDNGGDRRLQNMEPAVLGRTCAGRDK